MNQISDDQIGQNLRHFRDGMKQADLADKMRERGFTWSQNTVYQVESGSRPIRLTEAQALSIILGFPLDALFVAPIDNELEKVVETQIEELEEVWNHYVKAIRLLRSACRSFFEKEPPGLSEAESEELRIIKRAKQDEWVRFNFWQGFTEVLVKDALVRHGFEWEPLEYYNFEEDATSEFGVDRAVGFKIAEDLFEINKREEAKEAIKNFDPSTIDWFSPQQNAEDK